jgi:hypothetical protein
MGDYFPKQVTFGYDKAVKLAISAFERGADIATLGPPDDQACPEDYLAFVKLCEAIQGLAMSAEPINVDEPRPVHVLTHTGEWVRGTVTRPGWQDALPGPTAWLEAERPIRPGTSGSPVVDDAGRLVGIISWTKEVRDGEPTHGVMPVAHLALPRWLSDKIAST